MYSIWPFESVDVKETDEKTMNQKNERLQIKL